MFLVVRMGLSGPEPSIRRGPYADYETAYKEAESLHLNGKGNFAVMRDDTIVKQFSSSDLSSPQKPDKSN